MPRAVWPCLIMLLTCGCVSAQQPIGTLAGRIVYTSGGHGWTYHNSSDKWYTQRGDNNDLVEDYGNLDQMNMFVAYCFNAGATVVPFRPVGFQTNEVIVDNTNAQFSGAWSSSTATSGFYGLSGAVPYQFVAVAATETAIASYVPTLPAAGFYPVYTWASHGTNRTSQLYRIRHTGGEAQVRVPHDMVGNGWVYLGNYYFNAGSNSANGTVVISNLRASPSSAGVVIADAIRFGNGMGDVVPESAGSGTPTVSGYPREEECARYWVQRAIGVGGPESVYETSGDDGSDNVGAPPRMAAHMNRADVGSRYKRVFVSFHSNAANGTARGTLALHNGNHPGTSTLNQLRLAQLIGREVNDDLVALTAPPYEFEWYDRGSSVTYTDGSIAYGEISANNTSDEFDATIVEVGFHDNAEDAALMRDPKVRNVAARAAYQAIIRYMNEFEAVPLVFLPEPPTNVRAIQNGAGQVQIQWEVPPGGGGSPNGYVLYVSTNGYGFGLFAGVRGSGSVSLTLSNLSTETDWYFRVASTNAAGESLPSHVVGWRSQAEWRPPILFVNGFDRFDRTLDVRQTAGPGIGGPSGGSATFDRIKPRLINSFDYVVQHGKALSRSGVGFDSCENEAISSDQVKLTNYAAVIWAAGNESTADETFSASEQARISDYLARGGRLFVSGSEIAWDLDRDSGPTAADRAFLNNVLRADLDGNINDAAGTNSFGPAPTGIFSGNPSARFDDGTGGIYSVEFPDRLTSVGSEPALWYSGGTRNAGVEYADSVTGSKLVYWGFPFETITSAAMRDRYMFDVLRYFAVLPPPVLAQVSSGAASATVSWSSIPGARYRVQYQETLGQGNWNDLGADVVAPGTVASKTDTSTAGASQRFYRVLLLDL